MDLGKRHNEERETNPARLELLLRLEENLRICLEPIQMTPLQAGALLFLSRYAETKLTAAATLLGLEHPAVSVLVTALEHNGRMTKRRKVKYTCA
jgi:DNA-binding MarR family transcriptional regulator